ncbi:MAG: NIPSNAP family protein [Verrucomicrobiales bacterium]|nr:NIPSNAP family protein [Verrucomicrobiales bacterium]
MNRRRFLAAAATATVTASTTMQPDARAAAPGAADREFYELRRYHLRRGPKQKVFDDYLREAWLPAMRRIGIGPIGVFSVMLGPESPSTWVLVPYKSLDEFAGVPAKLREDDAYKRAAAEARNAPASDPTYLRYENTLLGSIASVPKIEVPAQTRAGKSRIFELRTYESHSKAANAKKIEMFDVGETALFRRAGLTPVFFGEALIGSRLPNLTYMLVFDDLAARDTAWKTFATDPEWKKLSSTPGFTDPEIVTDISNQLLRPAAYSEI